MNETERMSLAADWLQRLQSSAQDEAVLHDWLRWYQADAQNAAAFDRVHSVWVSFDDPTVRAAFRESTLQQPIKSDRFSRFAPVLGVAATILAAVGIASWQFVLSSRHDSRTLVTNVAEESKRMLSDGSRVNLGAATRVTMRYSKSERTVLMEDGEAYFQVKKDPLRPFVVHAGSLRVTAIGTAFTVKRTLNRVTVTVSEGEVGIFPEESRSGSVTEARPQSRVAQGHVSSLVDLRADAGDQVVFVESSHQMAINRVDPNGSWPFQEGVLRFIDEPLGNVLAEVNRISTHQIILTDKKLQNELYTGTVYEDRIDDWLRALTQVFAVRVTTREGGDTVLIAQ